MPSLARCHTLAGGRAGDSGVMNLTECELRSLPSLCLLRPLAAAAGLGRRRSKCRARAGSPSNAGRRNATFIWSGCQNVCPRERELEAQGDRRTATGRRHGWIIKTEYQTSNMGGVAILLRVATRGTATKNKSKILKWKKSFFFQLVMMNKQLTGRV